MGSNPTPAIMNLIKFGEQLDIEKEIEKMHTIESLQRKIHRIAVEHGWWKIERIPDSLGDEEYIEKELPIDTNEIGMKLALIHSEISEALELVRDSSWDIKTIALVEGKPEGVFVELADAIIRILDLAEHYEVDLEEIIELKMTYNESRPYRHGNKRA